MLTSSSTPAISSGSTLMGVGAMTSTSQFTQAISTSTTSTALSRASATNRCIGYADGNGAFAMSASYVSMDNDGFTINVVNANAAWNIYYEAFA